MTANQEKASLYLNELKRAEEAIQKKEIELDALRYRASGSGAIRYDKDKVQNSPESYMELAMDEIVKLSLKIDKDKDVLDKKLGRAYKLVKKLEDRDHRTLIIWFYLNGATMKITAERMAVSERKAYYIQETALEEFGKAL